MPHEPRTLGEHLKKRRLELGLRQSDVAALAGVCQLAISAWERDRCLIANRHWPWLVQFLGYNPAPSPATLGERLQAKYRELGKTRQEVARDLKVEVHTLLAYEKGRQVPTTKRHRQLVATFLASAGSGHTEVE